ncbi:protein disulfide isomerase 2 [Trypanosoma cruzi]|uniref:Protein disulfide-isomerase n=2 Tax=Trypanosoma cruzi TaxID=5693 RepID=A0A2V2VFG7_TRYCR|nr:protein disulfide isomerase 2 [Trypanosoma cruzi]
MIHFIFFVALFFCSLRAEGSEVVEATDKDFDDVISSGEIALVKFYAPWCGHCQKLAPEWEKAAKEIPSGAVMVDVDCTKESNLAQKYSIKGFPTIILFRDGKEVEHYKGGRKSSDIVNYVKANLGTAVVHVETAEELEKLREEHNAVCVGVTSDMESRLSKTLATSAEGLRMKMKFVVITDSNILPDEKPESIIVFRKGGEKEVFDGAMETADLKSFLEVAFIPFMGEINPNTYLDYAGISGPVAWVLLKPSEEESKELKSKLLDVGKKMRRLMVLLWVDAEQYGVASSLGLSDDAKYPAFVIARGEDHFVHPSTEPVTAESIEKFIIEYSEKKLSPEIKSQPVPEIETVEGLTTVVGKTLDKYLSSGKDMLIEFFAPWCGHCKNLAPIYAKVAKEFESSDVIIAAMDATANQVDNSLFDVSGFPTIYFVPHGGKPIVYDGGRTFYEIYKFVHEHSSTLKDVPIPEEVKREEEKNGDYDDL